MSEKNTNEPLLISGDTGFKGGYELFFSVSQTRRKSKKFRCVKIVVSFKSNTNRWRTA